MSTPTKQAQALELLQEGVSAFLASDAWKRSLEVRAKLHSYSFRNCLLILLQRPDASMVAGYKRWRAFGRQVRKGEKGLIILAPLVKKDKETEEREVFGFRAAHVFDVAQTDGEPLPDIAPKLLEQDGAEIRHLTTSLEHFAAAQGCPVERRDLGSAFGMYSRGSKKITLRPDLPPLQALKTLIHELGHALMHADRKQDEKRHTLELEAESCAFIVCHSLGLDTSSYSFAYLASWSEDPAELLPAGERACKAATQILAALEPQMERAA